jgi:hypothetical protein
MALILVVALAAGAAGVGLLAYNAGVAQGVAAGAKVESAPNSAGPYPYLAGPFHPAGFFGPGMSLLSCLLLFVGFVFVFGLVRRLIWGSFFWHRPFWGGPFWGRHAWRHFEPGQGGPADWQKAWEKGYPPIFEEWHRRAHGQGESTPPATGEPGRA